MRLITGIFIFCFSLSVIAMPMTNQVKQHVIYITLDGTRWQDVLLDKVYFTKLWTKYAKLGQFYGLPNHAETMEVASIPISLPSYQSQMAGAVQPCAGNSCGRIQVETLAEYLLKQNNFTKKDVVVFSSWWEIGLAVEKEQGRVFTSIGNTPVVDPETRQADNIMQDLNLKQSIDQPSEKRDRFDQYTFAQGLHYFETYQPKFMWIALTDADEAAHAADLNAYHQTLKLYDDALDNLFAMLIAKNLLASTMIIVTTDHGRGNGELWTSHGPNLPESKQTWAFVVNGKLLADPTQISPNYYSTLSMRPTIEQALL